MSIEDLCKYLGKILNFTMAFGSLEFRDVFLRCMLDCQRHLNPNVKMRDWDHVRIPMMFAFKWLAICAFERPRIAKLCSTKYETFYKGNSDTKSGRIVVDKVIGITAIQGHTYGSLPIIFSSSVGIKSPNPRPAFTFSSDSI